MFSGLIHFRELAEIADSFFRVKSDNIAVDQELIHKRFQERFSPVRLFRRALVYQEWNLQTNILGYQG